MTDWLRIHRGDAPLIVSFPHTGTEIPADVASSLRSPWLARKDADWWIDRLYDFAAGLGATTIRTSISRSVIDVNRDPSGTSLYPGQATTGLCPTETFDGEFLYRAGEAPDEREIARRVSCYFRPYHVAIAREIARLRAQHDRVVLYDAHAIRSVIPRLFEGALPHFNIGSFDGVSCAPELTAAIAERTKRSAFEHVVNGRFKGGWTTRHYGQPEQGVHAIQMELACRSYMDDPLGSVSEANWPSPYTPSRAEAVRTALTDVLNACLDFAKGQL